MFIPLPLCGFSFHCYLLISYLSFTLWNGHNWINLWSWIKSPALNCSPFNLSFFFLSHFCWEKNPSIWLLIGVILWIFHNQLEFLKFRIYMVICSSRAFILSQPFLNSAAWSLKGETASLSPYCRWGHRGTCLGELKVESVSQRENYLIVQATAPIQSNSKQSKDFMLRTQGCLSATENRAKPEKERQGRTAVVVWVSVSLSFLCLPAFSLPFAQSPTCLHDMAF